jgi:hypothetical protein
MSSGAAAGRQGVKYMLLMHADPAATKAMTAAQRAEIADKHGRLIPELTGPAEVLNGAGLAYPEQTRTLRYRPGAEPAESAGPLVAGSEHLTAYYVVECADAERAREIGALLVDFHVTAVEVRAVHDWFGMGDPPPGPPGRSDPGEAGAALTG